MLHSFTLKNDSAAYGVSETAEWQKEKISKRFDNASRVIDLVLKTCIVYTFYYFQEELKWIEDNIPSTFADRLLVDDEEDRKQMELELSKML